jgi:type I restriction enzyme, S subunit
MTPKVPLRYVLRPREEINRPDLRVLSVYRDHGVVPKDSREDNFNKTPLDLSRYQVVRPGDLVVNKMKAWQGSLAVSTHLGIVSPDYLVCAVAPGVDARYLHFLLRSAPLVAQYGSLSKGIRPAQWRLYWEDLATVLAQIPEIVEQRRIADFLDVQIARIEGVADARRRQIDLIGQRELSRVFDAISGATERGDRRFSGFPWLGDVPVDWPVLTVSSQFEVLLGKMLNQERARGEHLRPYLRNTNVQWDRIDTEDLLQMDFPPHERSRYEVRAGDLLICEGGQPGRSAIWDGSIPEIYYQKALHRARSRGRSSIRWLFYCLRAATALEVFTVEGNTTTISHLTGEQLRAHRFAFPDRQIQDRIVHQLDDAAHLARQTTDLLTRQLDLLAERRQALITAAVMGQIDVTTARGVDV